MLLAAKQAPITLHQSSLFEQSCMTTDMLNMLICAMQAAQAGSDLKNVSTMGQQSIKGYRRPALTQPEVASTKVTCSAAKYPKVIEHPQSGLHLHLLY